MKRWHDDFYVAKREWKKHRKMHVESNIRGNKDRIGQDPDEVDCSCDEQIGRFRKKDAYDCGKPHCGVCHYNKYPKRELQYHEIRSDFAFKEQLKEL